MDTQALVLYPPTSLIVKLDSPPMGIWSHDGLRVREKEMHRLV